MPPKQKMGSITHNSAEVNAREGKRGMLSKLKDSFTGQSSRTVSSSAKSEKAKAGSRDGRVPERRDGKLAKSMGQTSLAASSRSRGSRPRRTSSSFTQGDSTAVSPDITQLREQFKGNQAASFNNRGGGGIPTSITALVDAASCMTDDNMTQQNQQDLNRAIDYPPQIIEQPLGLEPPRSSTTRGVVPYMGGNDAAGRALANLHVGGSGDQLMPRNNSAEWGHNSWQHPIAAGAGNAGAAYPPYTYGDEYDDGGGGNQDYYDDTGGGLFDDAYMQSRRPSGGPPPVRRQSMASQGRGGMIQRPGGGGPPATSQDGNGAYHAGRRASNAESHQVPYRRSSNAEEYYAPPPAQDNTAPGYYRGPSQGSYETGSSPNGGSCHQEALRPPGMGKRASIDNSGCSGMTGGGRPRGSSGAAVRRHHSMEMERAGPGPTRGEHLREHPSREHSSREHSSREHSSSLQSRERERGDREHSSSAGSSSAPHNVITTVSAPPINTVVNNNGRGDGNGKNSGAQGGSGYGSSGSSRTKSPRPGGGLQRGSSARKMSGTSSGHNPAWFSEGGGEGEGQASGPSRPNRRSSATQPKWDDDDRTMATMATKAEALRPSAMNKAKDMTSPEGDVTIVYTDVQGSTSLWESCPSDMKEATDIHDMIMRQCYTNHSGYEITTEGDSFNLAFQHPVDALAFALQAQLKLYKADWPEGILRHSDGKDEPALKFRGFRVRFGIHHGPTNSKLHEMTGRTIYTGEGVKIAKAVEGMCHGGQILTTMETWKAVSGMAERYLGRPQILDCGEHLLFETKNANPANSGGGYTTTRYIRRVMQLVPSDLAFDFFEARGRREVKSEDGKMGFEIKDAGTVKGRLFPPLTSKRQLTTCFLNAPYANGRVTICFVYTVGLDDDPEHRAANLGVVAKYLRKQLLLLNPPGYECQEDSGCWMLAFDRMAHAVTFGLQLKSMLEGAEDLAGTVHRENMFKVGILSGPFTSMGPHKTTGMADYFGPIVNRAARVASSCEPGQVCVGIPLANGVTADPPDFGPTVNVGLRGIKKLKGITIDVAIFDCSRRRIETLY